MSAVYAIALCVVIVLLMISYIVWDLNRDVFKYSVIIVFLLVVSGIIGFSPFCVEYYKGSKLVNFSAFNNFSFSNFRVATFTDKKIDSYDNSFVFCYDDCLNYPASLSVSYDSIEEEKVLNLKFEMVKPIVFLEKNILNSDKEYELPIDMYVISLVYAGVVKSILSKYLSEHYNQSEEKSKFEFLLSKQKELNELFLAEGLKIEKISVN